MFIVQRIHGTRVALQGYLTYKADVYSFGAVPLEIVAGKNNTKFRPNEECICLLDWVRR